MSIFLDCQKQQQLRQVPHPVPSYTVTLYENLQLYNRVCILLLDKMYLYEHIAKAMPYTKWGYFGKYFFKCNKSPHNPHPCSCGPLRPSPGETSGAQQEPT